MTSEGTEPGAFQRGRLLFLRFRSSTSLVNFSTAKASWSMAPAMQSNDSSAWDLFPHAGMERATACTTGWICSVASITTIIVRRLGFGPMILAGYDREVWEIATPIWSPATKKESLTLSATKP